MLVKDMPDPFCNVRFLVILKDKNAVGAFGGNLDLIALLPASAGDSMIFDDKWHFNPRCALGIHGHGGLGPYWSLIE